MNSYENPRLAGYTLTRNRSIFLKTNGSVASLYNSPEFHSSLPILNKCYKRIPILFEEEIHFVDLISRETFTEAEENLCSKNHLNPFQLDVDDDNSWAEHTPKITKVIEHALFKSHIVIRQIANIITSSFHAATYTNKWMMDFWNSINFQFQYERSSQSLQLVNFRLLTIFFKNFRKKVFSSRIIYLNPFISPGFFYNQLV